MNHNLRPCYLSAVRYEVVRLVLREDGEARLAVGGDAGSQGRISSEQRSGSGGGGLGDGSGGGDRDSGSRGGSSGRKGSGRRIGGGVLKSGNGGGSGGSGRWSGCCRCRCRHLCAIVPV